METPESSKEYSRRKKRAVCEDFEEIIPNVIGKSAYLCYVIALYLSFNYSLFNDAFSAAETRVLNELLIVNNDWKGCRK